MILSAQIDIERDGESRIAKVEGTLRRGISHDIEAPRDDDELLDITASIDGVEIELTDAEYEQAEQAIWEANA